MALRAMWMETGASAQDPHLASMFPSAVDEGIASENHAFLCTIICRSSFIDSTTREAHFALYDRTLPVELP